MATWIVALKNRIQPPLPASILGHFTGTLLSFIVIGTVSSETAEKLGRSMGYDQNGNIIINITNIGKLILDDISEEDKRTVEEALKKLDESTEIVITREKTQASIRKKPTL